MSAGFSRRHRTRGRRPGFERSGLHHRPNPHRRWRARRAGVAGGVGLRLTFVKNLRNRPSQPRVAGSNPAGRASRVARSRTPHSSGSAATRSRASRAVPSPAGRAFAPSTRTLHRAVFGKPRDSLRSPRTVPKSALRPAHGPQVRRAVCYTFAVSADVGNG